MVIWQRPQRILSIDIETEITRLRKPEESLVAVIGIVPYFLDKNGHYRRGSYKHFLRDQIQDFHAFLVNFDGLILGQNLFDFDYRVLRPHMSFEGIIEKTFDLYFFLDSIDSGKRSRLSLEVLAYLNLKKRKLSLQKDISALWRMGGTRQVLRRNERDCDLVAELWLKLIKERSLKSKLRSPSILGSPRTRTRLHIEDVHIPIVHGYTPLITHTEWIQRIVHWGNARRDPKTGGKTIIEDPIDAGDLALFHRLMCTGCSRNFVLRAGRSRIYKQRAAKSCPFCKKRVPLINGTTLIRTFPDQLRFIHTSGANDHIFTNNLPSDIEAREFIRRLRFWSY